MKKPATTRTTDALASFLYDLMRDYLPTGVVEKIVVDCEQHNQGAAILHGYLGPYAVDLAERLRQTSKEMFENDPIGTTGCPVGPTGIPGPSDDLGASYGGVREYEDGIVGEDIELGVRKQKEVTPEGMVVVATENGCGYTTRVGDPGHDTPEARARGILAQKCEDAGLPLHRIFKLRKELNDYVQQWMSTTAFKRDPKDNEEFNLMNTSGLFMGIDDYLKHPSGARAATLHARSAPFLARLGKDSLLIQG